MTANQNGQWQWVQDADAVSALSHDGCARIVLESSGIYESTVTVHDHTDTFADNPIASFAGPSLDVGGVICDTLTENQPEGTDWFAWATHYLAEICPDQYGPATDDEDFCARCLEVESDCQCYRDADGWTS